MSNDKHFVKAKHFDTTTQKRGNSNLIKIIFKILVLIIIILSAYFVYDKYLKDLDILAKFKNTNTEIEETYYYSDFANLETTLSVNGADYFQVTGIQINNISPEFTSILASLKNTSNESYENVTLRITLFDENNNELTHLDYTIDKIEANSDFSSFCTSREDLSNCTNYSITIKQ